MSTSLSRAPRHADIRVFGPCVLMVFAWLALGACGDQPGDVLPTGFSQAAGDEQGCDYLGRPRSVLQSHVAKEQECVDKYGGESAACQGKVMGLEGYEAKYGCDRRRQRQLQVEARSKVSYDAKDPVYAELDRVDAACGKADSDAKYDTCSAGRQASRNQTVAICQGRLATNRADLASFDACVAQKRQARAAASQPSGGSVITPGAVLLTPGIIGGFSSGGRSSRARQPATSSGHGKH